MASSPHNVTLAGSPLHEPCHACAFFHEPEEEDGLLLPFVREAFQQADKSFQIVDGRRRDDRLARIASLGIDVEAAGRSGQLEIRTWEQAYLRGGRFDPDAMLALVEEVLREGDRAFGRTRLWANMEWALEDFPGTEALIEYEARLNEVTDRLGDPVICSYDMDRFSASVVMDVLRTHPQVIVAGVLQQNPFYVPPGRFLEELRTRNANRS